MRKLLAVLCVMTLTLSMLTACGSAKETESAAEDTTAAAAETETADDAAETEATETETAETIKNPASESGQSVVYTPIDIRL